MAQLKKQLYREDSSDVVIQPLLQKYGLEDRVFLIQSEKLFCFCFGFLQPKIYISTQMFHTMNVRELEAVLLHEHYHLSHKDSLFLLLAFLIELLFPFFPLISDLLSHYKITRELRADEFAIYMQGDSFHLLSVLRKLLQVSPYSLSGSAPLAGDTLEARIRFLTKRSVYVKRVSIANILISLFSFVFLFFILVTPVRADTTPQHNGFLFCSSSVKASLPFSWAIDK